MSTRRVVLDSNLLILLIVGRAHPSLVLSHKRLHGFTVEHFRLLVGWLASYATIVTTPHVLAEASNLLRSGGLRDSALRKVNAGFKDVIGHLVECHRQASTVKDETIFDSLGLTDAVIVAICSSDTCMLTKDHELYQRARKLRVEAYIFNHFIDHAR